MQLVADSQLVDGEERHNAIARFLIGVANQKVLQTRANTGLVAPYSIDEFLLDEFVIPGGTAHLLYTPRGGRAGTQLALALDERGRPLEFYRREDKVPLWVERERQLHRTSPPETYSIPISKPGMDVDARLHFYTRSGGDAGVSLYAQKFHGFLSRVGGPR